MAPASVCKIRHVASANCARAHQLTIFNLRMIETLRRESRRSVFLRDRKGDIHQSCLAQDQPEANENFHYCQPITEKNIIGILYNSFSMQILLGKIPVNTVWWRKVPDEIRMDRDY